MADPFNLATNTGRGRPRGSPNKVARECQETLDGYAENLTKKCVMLAYQGNPTAMRLCMERLMPARRQRAVTLKLPTLTTIADVAVASTSVVNAVARGQLTPTEGQLLSDILEGRRRIIETQEQDQRIRALEDLNQPPRGPR